MSLDGAVPIVSNSLVPVPNLPIYVITPKLTQTYDKYTYIIVVNQLLLYRFIEEDFILVKNIRSPEAI